nr:RNA polymerase sigma factor [Pseudobacter ginsenosidimutans]
MIQQIQSGNIQSFEKVYQQYHSKLYYYVLRHCHSTYLSEETVQLTFIKMWENRKDLSLQYDIAIQLFRIARSTMIDLLRKERTANRYLLHAVDDISDIQEAGPTDYKEDLKQVEALIEDLSPVRKKFSSSAALMSSRIKRLRNNCPFPPRPLKTISGAPSGI